MELLILVLISYLGLETEPSEVITPLNNSGCPIADRNVMFRDDLFSSRDLHVGLHENDSRKSKARSQNVVKNGKEFNTWINMEPKILIFKFKEGNCSTKAPRRVNNLASTKSKLQSII